MNTPSGGTGILLMNLGGPATLDGVAPFLLNVMADRDFIRIPLQRWLGPITARRRTQRLHDAYAAIGGGSPILAWTEKQARALEARLDQLRPQGAPHRGYVAFRHTSPTADDALRTMARDGIEHVVAFPQLPQWSCTTSGSLFIDLGEALLRTGTNQRFRWSFIDRWPAHAGFIGALAERVREGLAQYPASERGDVVLLFTARAVPRYAADRGDSYPHEVATTVALVMEHLRLLNRHELGWQPDSRPAHWLGPTTESQLRSLAAEGRKRVMVVPVASTADQLETLGSIDRDCAGVAKALGMTGYSRAATLNDLASFSDAMATMVVEHLERDEPWSREYRRKCAECRDTRCRPAFEGMGERPAA